MTMTERLRLMAFGLFGWSVTLFTAYGSSDPLIVSASALQAGLMASCFGAALLPGRMARFDVR